MSDNAPVLGQTGLREPIPSVRVLGRMLVALESARQQLHTQTDSAERALERYGFTDSAAREHMSDLNQGMRWVHEALRYQMDRAAQQVESAPTPENIEQPIPVPT